MALSLDIKIGGSLWGALALTPLSQVLIERPLNREWESGVKAKALQSFALIHLCRDDEHQDAIISWRLTG